MTMLAVERIKLFSTRSPWWCALITLVVTIGYAALLASTTDDPRFMRIEFAELGYSFGLAVVMVLAALTVTTEYRFNTIKTTFQAHPNRATALLAKAGVVGVLSFVLGEIAGFGAWGMAALLSPEADLALRSAGDWVNVVGIGPVYAFGAALAIGVGLLIRHSAGAIALLLIYSLAVEDLVRMIPNIGEDVFRWMPFNVADKFVSGNGDSRGGLRLSTSELTQPWALAYFGTITVIVLALGIVTAKRRDA